MDDPRLFLDVMAPLSGVRVPLARVPDAVFAGRMVGDGASLDPTSSELLAPVAGEVVQLHASRHALTLRTAQGIELLLHIGIDTVALRGAGFEALVAVGEQVRIGQPLIRFDIDAVAQRARSLLTQVVVANMDRVAAIEPGRGELLAGQSLLFRVRLQAAAGAPTLAVGSADAAAEYSAGSLRLPNPVGLHARPAALIAETARGFQAELHLCRGDARANARSVVSILALAAQQGDLLRVEARGADAQAARDALLALLASGCGDDLDAAPVSEDRAPMPAARGAGESAAGELHGIVASPGIAVGRVVHWRRTRLDVVEHGDGSTAERRRLEQALASADHALACLQASLADRTRAGILEAHRALLQDPELQQLTFHGIDRGQSAGHAWRRAFEQHAATLDGLGNALLRERAADLRDVGERVLALLVGVQTRRVEMPPDTILIAEELTPSDTAQLDRRHVLGFCSTGGGATGHVAILARALGIPALCAIDPAALRLSEGLQIILDGERGLLQTTPDAQALASALERMQAAHAQQAREQATAKNAAHTRDGLRVEVAANVRNAADTAEALNAGAEGVGLLRSEFLFDARASAPDEEEQASAYRSVAELLGAERRLVIRTLDVGGDKPLAYLPLPTEDNPFLGLRGIRVSLARPELLRTQLRAILRSADACRLHIMLPMVATLDELRQVRSMLDEERAMLGVGPVALGIMVEVPSAALLAEAFAREVDFFSIGSNDLTQYTLAMDRGHPQLAAQADALHPAVLRLIDMACRGAARHGRWVGLCGALASDPLAAPLLVGLGISELSVSTPAIAAVKAALARVNSDQCRDLAAAALALEDAAAVRQLLDAARKPA